MNSYELSRSFCDWSFENPQKIKPIHYAIYFFAIEHCNRLGWKTNFGLPSQMVMEAIGVKNWRTYSSGLSDLVDFGFIKMVEVSKNQYSSNIIAIVKNTKAPTKALDKALSKHSTKQTQKQGTKQGQSTVSIDKQYNNITKNKEQYNKEQVKTLLFTSINDETSLSQNENIAFSFWTLFRENLISTGISNTATLDKAKVAKWTNDIRLMIESDKRSVEEIRIVWHFLKSNEFWKKNIQSTAKLREQFERLFQEAKTIKPKDQKEQARKDWGEDLARRLKEMYTN